MLKKLVLVAVFVTLNGCMSLPETVEEIKEDGRPKLSFCSQLQIDTVFSKLHDRMRSCYEKPVVVNSLGQQVAAESPFFVVVEKDEPAVKALGLKFNVTDSFLYYSEYVQMYKRFDCPTVVEVYFMNENHFRHAHRYEDWLRGRFVACP